jgi:hypothetical protein
MTPIRIADRAGNCHPIAWVSPIPDDWRSRPVSISGLRAEISFPRFEVREGDTIGCFTIVSEPVTSPLHDKCHYTCWELRHVIDVTHFYADMLCSCGWLIPGTEIRGDRYQRLSCGHYVGMNPDHRYHKNWPLNAGARFTGDRSRDVA